MNEPDCTPACTISAAVFDEFVGEIALGLKSSRNDDESTAVVEGALPRLLKDGGWLPPENRAPNPDTYARNLIHRDPELGFVVVAMVWQPGQGTPVHDHSGIWCVEGVLEGSVRITQYDPVENESPAESFQLRQSGRFESRIGDTGRLIPPFEFHKIENVSDRTAITIHVYGKDLVDCRIFEDLGNGSFAAKSIQMQYNPAALPG